MIYTASLALPVAKAFGKQAMQSNINKICELISLDPDTSNMDVVIFGPNDTLGPKLTKLEGAIENAHPDVCIIYMYQRDGDKDILDVPNKFKCKTINKNAVKEAFETFVGEHQIRQGKRQVTSADFEEDPDLNNVGGTVTPKDPISKRKKNENPIYGLFRGKAKRPDNSGVPDIGEEIEVDFEDDFKEEQVRVGLDGSTVNQNSEPEEPKLNIPERDRETFTKRKEVLMDTKEMAEQDLPKLSDLFDKFDEQEKSDNPENEESDTSENNPTLSKEEVKFLLNTDSVEESEKAQQPSETISPTTTFEGTLETVTSFEDWALLKEKLNHDSMLNNLIKENSEYAGLINMIDVLNKRIETVWRDTTLSPEEKFNKVKEIGLEKSTIKATTNSVSTQKVISMISEVVLVAKRNVEEKIQSIDKAMYKIASSDAKLQDTSHIDIVIEERTKIQMDLLRMAREIVDLYTRIDDVVVSEIQELDSKLPSASEFINSQMSPIGTQIFTPINTSVLVNRLTKCLQENKIVASALENHVNAVVEQLFKLCERDEEVISYMQNSINLLKANRVEDAVIVDTLLKNILRLYTGMDNTGRSATAITWCGILSRRQNTLLIDLTGRSKFREYGITPIGLDEFMDTRIEQQFLCVESDHILDAQELQEMVKELRLRLNYYPYVNIIVAPEDMDGLSQLSEEAMCVHYITDCTPKSIEFMSDVIRDHTTANIARKLITIDTPVSPLMIADSLNVDPTRTKLITLPAIPTIRACALKRDRPYEYSEVVHIFEEAFR